MAAAKPPVIVGVDGSAASRRALTWALDKADRFGPVKPVLVFRPPVSLGALARRGTDAAAYRTLAEARLRAFVGEIDANLTACSRVIEGHPGAALCDAAREGALLVVGSPGRSPAADALVGATGSYCIRHSQVPAAVVPSGFPADKPIRSIVVGVDGSSHAEHGLRWALDHARPGDQIVAVGALPTWGFTDAGTDPLPGRVERAVRARVEKSVERVVGASEGGPSVTIRVVGRDARTALRDRVGSSADLVVVGARGLGLVRFLLLGSVSSALAHHPRVPTVVVRQPTDR